jgi:hypothetical protein
MWRRLILALGCLSLLVTTTGCGLFAPRDPEPPATQAISYLPRSSAANVWENCRLALVNKDTGGWDTAVAENFQYEPDGDTRSAFPNVDWENWGKSQEMSFINSWFATNVTIDADLLDTPINTPDGAGGFAEWELIYFLEVEDNQTGSTTKYRANAVLQFELQGSFWYLSYWRDQNGEDDPDNPGSTLETMGRLRGAFAP